MEVSSQDVKGKVFVFLDCCREGACSMKPILVAGVIVALAGVLAFVLTLPDPITFGLAWGAMALVSLVGYRLYWRMGRD